MGSTRHRFRGLTTGHLIRHHPSTSCCGTYDSVLVAPQLQGAATGGNWGILLFCSPGFLVLGVFCARFPPRDKHCTAALLRLRGHSSHLGRFWYTATHQMHAQKQPAAFAARRRPRASTALPLGKVAMYNRSSCESWKENKMHLPWGKGWFQDKFADKAVSQ
jgi:hypothetical protein